MVGQPLLNMIHKFSQRKWKTGAEERIKHHVSGCVITQFSEFAGYMHNKVTTLAEFTQHTEAQAS